MGDDVEPPLIAAAAAVAASAFDTWVAVAADDAVAVVVMGDSGADVSIDELATKILLFNNGHP